MGFTLASLAAFIICQKMPIERQGRSDEEKMASLLKGLVVDRDLMLTNCI